MPASEAQVNANRLNAARSTGPKTDEGKERSRRNGLKHGLAGAGLVVPEADAEEIERRAQALEADMKPRSPAGALLILKMATLSVRMERAGRQESFALARRVRHAVGDFDEERFDRADQLYDAIHEAPRRALRKLKRSPEGVDRLLEAWRGLRADLTREIRRSWTAAHLEKAAHLVGLRSEEARDSQVGAWSRGIWGDFEGLGDREGGGLGEEARQAWSKARLLERIDEEVAALEAHRETLDFEMIELDRLEAPGRALFDPSGEATLARRYEAEASRGFFKALKEFRQVEAESEAKAEAAPDLPPPSQPARPVAPLASCRDWMPPADHEPAWAYQDAPTDQFSVVLGRDGQPLSIGRPAQPPG